MQYANKRYTQYIFRQNSKIMNCVYFLKSYPPSLHLPTTGDYQYNNIILTYINYSKIKWNSCIFNGIKNNIIDTSQIK